MSAAKTMWLDAGCCPFATCPYVEEGHTHPICETCGAVRYGNAFCATCRSHLPERMAEMEEFMRRVDAQG